MRISQLAQATTVNDEDVFPVVQDGETKKVTAKALFDNQPTDIVIDEENNLQLMAGDKPVGEGVPMPDIDQTYNPTGSNAQSGVAVAEATKEVKDYAKNTLANAIKGSVSGTVISIDDISPIEHIVSLKVENKNLIPFTDKSYFGGKYVAGQTYEVNGVSYTVNDDGSVYAVGTATNGASIFYLYYVSTYETGTDTVTLSGSPEGATNTTYFLRLKNGTSANSNYQDYGNGVTINNVDVKGSVITIIVMNGQTVDATFYPQLEYGTTATEFSTPVDPSTVTVTKRGNNIADIPNLSFTGYSMSLREYIQWYIDLPIGTEITVSADINTAETTSATIAWYINLTDGTKICVWIGNHTNSTTKRFSFTHIKTANISSVDDIASVPICLGQGNTSEKTFENITVNIGDADLGYEEYINGGTYTPNADGTVSGFYSLSPNMTIYADTADVTMNCEYNKDTNVVIDDIKDVFKNGTYELVEEITVEEAGNISKSVTPSGENYAKLYKNMIVSVFNSTDKPCSICYIYRGNDLCMLSPSLEANTFNIFKAEMITNDIAEWTFCQRKATGYGTNLLCGCVETSNNISRVLVSSCTVGTKVKIYGKKL